MNEYNGWKNRQTWNVALWIGNDYSLYQSACEYMRTPRMDGKQRTYKGFIKNAGLWQDRTPDNVAWISTRLDYAALNEMMRELVA